MECDCGKRLGQLTCPICSEVGKSMNENDFDREFDLDRSIAIIKVEDEELLNRLASD